MQVINTNLENVKVIKPTMLKDKRGYFFESWNAMQFKEAGIHNTWVQENQSKSHRGVIRGLHYQVGTHAQAKLVRVLYGRIRDIAVDVRKESSTFGQHVSYVLDYTEPCWIYIPNGFAHGFEVLSEEAVITYKCNKPYSPNHEQGIAYNDPFLNITWWTDENERILSEKDKNHPTLSELEFYKSLRKRGAK